MLIGGALVGPANHARSIASILTLNVEALFRTQSVDDVVSLAVAEMARVHALNGVDLHPVTLTSAVQRKVGEARPNTSVLIHEPELVGGEVALAPVGDDVGPGTRVPIVHVQHLPVELTHDVELTPGGGVARCTRTEGVALGVVTPRRIALSRRIVRHFRVDEVSK